MLVKAALEIYLLLIIFLLLDAERHIAPVLLPKFDPCCRYTRLADWGYVRRCAEQAPGLPLIGNGDVFSWADYQARVNADSPLTTAMIARSVVHWVDTWPHAVG